MDGPIDIEGEILAPCHREPFWVLVYKDTFSSRAKSFRSIAQVVRSWREHFRERVLSPSTSYPAAEVVSGSLATIFKVDLGFRPVWLAEFYTSGVNEYVSPELRFAGFAGDVGLLNHFFKHPVGDSGIPPCSDSGKGCCDSGKDSCDIGQACEDYVPTPAHKKLAFLGFFLSVIVAAVAGMLSVEIPYRLDSGEWSVPKLNELEKCITKTLDKRGLL